MSAPESYRDRLDSNLERELLEYTLDTGSPLVRELKPLLFPIADNALQARQQMGSLARDVRDVVKRVAVLEEREKGQAVEAHRWKWWVLGVVGPLISAALTGAGFTLAK